ncbi:MAG: hypothetical protein HY741_08070 [Chloroflexi bacterium]|nr:hypothetical protein [Chloroflexota bacterium]
MLLEIEKKLGAQSPDHVTDIELERDAVTFHTVFKFSRDARAEAVFPMPGKINQRGFCQHTLTLAPIPGVPLGALLDELVPELKRAVGDLLYSIAPDAVRSKLAILSAGVTPFQQFQSATLDPPTELAARDFLFDAQVSAILLDAQTRDSVRAGFVVPSLGLQVKTDSADAGAFTSCTGNTLLFYSGEFTPDEWATHDSVIYKYCALVLYAHTLDRTTSILKQARDHLIPLRRRVAIALQGNVAEHFDALTQIKRYLMYVNIKLPVIQNVIRHLEATRHTQTFAAKMTTFDAPIKVFGYPTIRSIENTTWQPPYLIGKINEETRHLDAMFAKDLEEIQIVSTELSQMLEGSLLAEQLQIAQQSLDAAQTMLEIERRTKNLANANKSVITLLMAAIGMVIAITFQVGWVETIAVGSALFALGYFTTAFALKRHASYFRLVIPIRACFPPEALASWIGQHRLVKNNTNGNQITCSWKQTIPVRLLSHTGVQLLREHNLTREHDLTREQNLARAYNNGTRPRHNEYLKQTFDVTVEFLRRGFLSTVTLETEYFDTDFETHDLVERVFAGLLDSACLKPDEPQETSLYARTLSLLELPLEEHLPALNKLLTLPSVQVSQIIQTGASSQEDASLSKVDLNELQDLNGQPRAYKEWLSETLSNPTRSNLLGLLGLRNVQNKLRLLERLEEEHIQHAHI